jgi:SOS-response transcriptional repressor LexA
MLTTWNRRAGYVLAVSDKAKKSLEADVEAHKRREAFQAFMRAHDITDIAAWARRAGLPNANAVYNFLRGRSRSLSAPTLEKLVAVVPEAKPGDLFKEALTIHHGQLRTAWIRGEIQAGAWRDRAEWPRGDWKTITLPASTLHRSTRTYFLVVRGSSMNLLYPDGTIIECVDLQEHEGKLKSGDKVIVERQDRNGLYETTCKELRFKGNRAELWPRSDDPEQQGVISLPWPPEDGETPHPQGIEAIRIKAVVIRSIRDET